MSFTRHGSRLVIALFCAVLGAAASSVHAQVNPEIANCEEIRDEATQTQVNFCTAHAGCRFVMSLHKACAAVKGFLNRLMDISAGRNAPDLSDAFDAAAPPVTADPAYTRASDATRDSFKRQGDRVVVARDTSVLEGPVVDGKLHGAGVFVTAKGSMLRGQWVEGQFSGKGEMVVFHQQVRAVGDFQNYRLNGRGIRRSPGDRYEGEFKANRFEGQGVFNLSDGFRYEGGFSSNIFHGQGTATLPSGTKLTGEFREGKFFSGQQTNAGGQVVATYSGGIKTAVSAAEADAGFAEFLGVLAAIAGVVVEQRQARRQTGSSTTPSSPASSTSPQPVAVTSSAPARPQARPEASPSPSGGNPENDATHCVRVISEAEMKAMGIRSITTKGFLNKCGFPAIAVFCYVGRDCNPGYSNMSSTMQPGSFHGLAGGGRSGQVAYGACRAGPGYGFGKGNHIANRELKHVCN